MENIQYIALSRQAALWNQLQAVANNMANANTPAFKAEQVMFREFLVEPPASARADARPVAFVQDVGVLRNMREGPLTHTDNPLDLAIQGEGFFVVETPDGMRYTRNGHFQLDDTGMLVTTDGHAVMQEGDQPIFFAPNETEIHIAKDGTVSTENGPIGRLRLVGFENDQELRKVAGGLYATTAEPQPVAEARVLQGMVEESNVQPVLEMTNMIAILRNYQGVQKMIDTDHERQMKAFDVLSNAKRV